MDSFHKIFSILLFSIVCKIIRTDFGELYQKMDSINFGGTLIKVNKYKLQLIIHLHAAKKHMMLVRELKWDKTQVGII